jgi:hypothetical protein
MTASSHPDLISVKLAMAKLQQAAAGFFSSGRAKDQACWKRTNQTL